MDGNPREKWHPTDYMQHRIIGPVVLQVHKSDVLEPGTYSITPEVTHWEAPGHIATDDQLLKLRIAREPSGKAKEPKEIEPYFNYWTSEVAPNTNWPLPGHVITNAHTQPGTDIWDRHKMSEYDW